jgi:hypothetical protein
MSTVEKAQDQLDALADAKTDSTDSDIRYLAYGARLRTALRAGTRYIAYVRLALYNYAVMKYLFCPCRPVMWGRRFALSFLLGLSLPPMAFLGYIWQGLRIYPLPALLDLTQCAEM